MHCSALLPLQCCLLSEPYICAEPVPGSGRETVHLAFWSGMGVTGFLDRVYVGSVCRKCMSGATELGSIPG